MLYPLSTLCVSLELLALSIIIILLLSLNITGDLFCGYYRKQTIVLLLLLIEVHEKINSILRESGSRAHVLHTVEEFCTLALLFPQALAEEVKQLHGLTVRIGTPNNE